MGILDKEEANSEGSSCFQVIGKETDYTSRGRNESFLPHFDLACITEHRILGLNKSSLYQTQWLLTAEIVCIHKVHVCGRSACSRLLPVSVLFLPGHSWAFCQMSCCLWQVFCSDASSIAIILSEEQGHVQLLWSYAEQKYSLKYGLKQREQLFPASSYLTSFVSPFFISLVSDFHTSL